MLNMQNKDEYYKKYKRKRRQYVKDIIQSSAERKIVVAGPGTGKTYLFTELLEELSKEKKHTLTLTFVNALVDDLSLELCKISEVRTLHSFACSILKGHKVYPKLSKVINEDAKILLGLDEKFEFDTIFYNRDDQNEYIDFYKVRKKYYGGYYGFTDIIYGAVKLLETKKNKIPKYDQIVVDEFQDFNKLEVSLIELLAEKNHILLTGDDDQAIYTKLKSADPKYIRAKCNEYEPFDLPYCSRCTRVIVDAVNDIINIALEKGYLKDRRKKPFEYYPCEKKDEESQENQRIDYIQCPSNMIPYTIKKHIEKIAQQERKPFTVLIISTNNQQTNAIKESLEDKGFKNINHKFKEKESAPSLLEGLILLLKAKKECNKCNLGWRIVAKHILNEDDFKDILSQTHNDETRNFSDLIDKENKKEINKLLTNLRAVRDKKDIANDEFAEFLKKVQIDPYIRVKNELNKEIKLASLDNFKKADKSVRKIPITITTIQSAKGLDADYVFITHFDDRFYINDKENSLITDQKICNFIVSLTRARKKVFLISSDVNKTPEFLGWIDPARINSSLKSS